MLPLTILTPTYNRADLLTNCFRSLCSQSCFNFEWLIVDDGSTDNTQSVAEGFAAGQSDFPVRYVRKENGGKHTALNFSRDFIAGEYMLILDSDDTLTPDAVETILKKWAQYRQDDAVWCISLQKGYDTDTPVCDYQCDADFISDYLRYRINGKAPGDCAEVVRSDIFRGYSFPEFPGERFLGEDCMWLSVGQRYQTVYCQKIVYLCDYLEGGLTKSGRKMRMSNPLGGMYRCNLYLRKDVILSERIKKAILYDCYALSAGRCREHLHKARMPWLCGMLLPVGWLLRKKWSR